MHNYQQQIDFPLTIGEPKTTHLKHAQLTTKTLRKVMSMEGAGAVEKMEFDSCAIELNEIIEWAARRIDTLQAENNQMVNALCYVLENEHCLSDEGKKNVRIGLGSEE